jgi:hypothetical protein
MLVSELVRGPRDEPLPHAAVEALILQPGMKIGRYVVGEPLGNGGMGVVYAGYDPELDSEVALKVLRPDIAGDSVARARLLSEARAMARLSHPGVVPIHDVGTLGDAVVLAMALIDGQDARRWLDQARPSWREVMALLSQAGRGLAAAHVGPLQPDDRRDRSRLYPGRRRHRVRDLLFFGGGLRDEAFHAATICGAP